ncbi:MAG: acetyl-CoA carboxylase biotin carboxyl carrier protein subunit, partial [Thermaurantiacus sp.]
GFIAEHEEELFAHPPAPATAVAAAAAAHVGDGPAGHGFARPFRLNLPAETSTALWGPDGVEVRLRITRAPDGLTIALADDTSVRVEADEDAISVHADGAVLHPVLVRLAGGHEVRMAGHAWRFFASNPAWEGHSAAGPADGTILAPMPGKVLSVHVRTGEQVKAGDRLAVLEAMKMEHRLTAPFDGRVEAVHVTEGLQVAEGTLLVEIAK